MENEYHGIKWIDPQTATRFSREVKLQCIVKKGGTFLKDGIEVTDPWQIILVGTGDCEHHIIEDAAILLKKMCDVKCGNHSI